jgi:hypothetical protein
MLIKGNFYVCTPKYNLCLLAKNNEVQNVAEKIKLSVLLIYNTPL